MAVRGGAPEPMDLATLAARLARRAVALAVTPGASPASPRVARVAVDGAVPADTTLVGDALARAVADLGRPVACATTTDFLHQPSVRLEHGAADADTGYERWVDHLALRREVLDPLGPAGSLRWLPSLRDAASGRATRLPPRAAVAGTVAIVTGPFLLRRELADAVDVGVHLSTSPAAISRRLDGDERLRVLGAWDRYLTEARPAERADVVVAMERPTRPALLRGW